jgi:lysophospholipase L1-like esterase
MPDRKAGGKRTRRRRAGRDAKAWAAAVRCGREQARLVLERRRRRAAARGVGAARGDGLLVAEGDSWFDYPFVDVLGELEDGFGYAVESVAHKGDTIEEMVYDPNQLEKLARKLQKLAEQRRTPRAILLSGGGNDIAGEEFGVLLNHRRSGLPALNAEVVAGVLQQRIRAAVISLASAVTDLCRQSLGAPVPILIHGYDYPVPDGRGYLGGFWVLPGPWLEPGFRRKGYHDLRERCDVMITLIDAFNALLAGVARGPGLEHLRHVDLRRTLSSALARGEYKEWWGNELHPTERGFRAVAERFHRVLSRL